MVFPALVGIVSSASVWHPEVFDFHDALLGDASPLAPIGEDRFGCVNVEGYVEIEHLFGV